MGVRKNKLTRADYIFCTCEPSTY